MVKAKSFLLHAVEAYGGVEVWLHSLALDGGKWPTSSCSQRAPGVRGVPKRACITDQRKYVKYYQAIFIDVTTGGPEVP
jgi:hypothetical protein